MRDKDQIILENCYSKIKPFGAVILEQEEDIYRVALEKKDVDMRVYTDDDDIHLDEHSQIYLKFRLQMNRESYGLDILVHLLEIEPFKMKLVQWTEGDDKEFFFNVPGIDISHVNATFDQTTSREHGGSRSYIQLAPHHLEFEVHGVRGTRGLESRKFVSYAIDPKTVEVDFSR
jgi:hypothetical protein